MCAQLVAVALLIHFSRDRHEKQSFSYSLLDSKIAGVTAGVTFQRRSAPGAAYANDRPCPLWVISGHCGPLAMSAIGPKRTFVLRRRMPALEIKETSSLTAATHHRWTLVHFNSLRGRVFLRRSSVCAFLVGKPRGLYRTLPRFFAGSWRWVVGSHSYNVRHGNCRDSVGLHFQTSCAQIDKPQLIARSQLANVALTNVRFRG